MYRLSSYRCISLMKYSVRSLVLLTHCNAAFIKQVLPKLFRPVAPFSAGTMKFKKNKQIIDYIT